MILDSFYIQTYASCSHTCRQVNLTQTTWWSHLQAEGLMNFIFTGTNEDRLPQHTCSYLRSPIHIKGDQLIFMVMQVQVHSPQLGVHLWDNHEAPPSLRNQQRHISFSCWEKSPPDEESHQYPSGSLFTPALPGSGSVWFSRFQVLKSFLIFFSWFETDWTWTRTWKTWFSFFARNEWLKNKWAWFWILLWFLITLWFWTLLQVWT